LIKKNLTTIQFAPVV